MVLEKVINGTNRYCINKNAFKEKDFSDTELKIEILLMLFWKNMK